MLYVIHRKAHPCHSVSTATGAREEERALCAILRRPQHRGGVHDQCVVEVDPERALLLDGRAEQRGSRQIVQIAGPPAEPSEGG